MTIRKFGAIELLIGGLAIWIAIVLKDESGVLPWSIYRVRTSSIFHLFGPVVALIGLINLLAGDTWQDPQRYRKVRRVVPVLGALLGCLGSAWYWGGSPRFELYEKVALVACFCGVGYFGARALLFVLIAHSPDFVELTKIR
jgi:hypothetical protein